MQKNDIFNYVHVCKEGISKEDCHSVVSYTESLMPGGWTTHKWSNYYGDVTQEGKEFLVFNDINPFIDKFITAIEDCMNFYLGMFNVNGLAPLNDYSLPRLNCYTEGTRIRTHIDHIHSLFDGEKTGIPVLSMVGVLNDDYEGGEFFVSERKFELETGDIIIFPSIFLFPHEVTTVTKGRRHSWVSWAW